MQEVNRYFIVLIAIILISGTATALNYSDVTNYASQIFKGMFYGKETTNFDDENRTLSISDPVKGDFTIRQLDIENYPIICNNLIVCKQENFKITPSDKNYEFSGEDLDARSELHNGRNGIYLIEYYQLKNESFQVENLVLNWSNTSREIKDDSNTTNKTVWDNVSSYVPDGTYHTEYGNVWIKLNGIDKLKGRAGDNFTIAMVFYKKTDFGYFSIKTIPKFVGYEEERMTWWNSSWGNALPIYLNNTGNASNQTYFPVRFNLTYREGMNPDFSDIRPLNDTTVLTYCIDTVVNNSYVTGWINFSYIPASSWDNTTYLLYYNNSAATSAGNCQETFTDYIDYNDVAGWSVDPDYGTGSFSTPGDNITRFSSTFNNAALYYHSILHPYNNITIETVVTQYASGAGNNQYRNQISDTGDYSTGNTFVSTDVTNQVGNGVTVSHNSAYRYIFKINGTNSTGISWNRYNPDGTLNYGIQNTTFEEAGAINQAIAYIGIGKTGGTGFGITTDNRYWVVRKWAPVDPDIVFGTSQIYTPPQPVIQNVTTGNFWKFMNWTAGSGVITDGFNLSRNGTWYNGTDLSKNSTTTPHGNINDTLYAWNATGNKLSAPVTNNTQIPNNPITISNISASYSLNDSEMLNIYPTYSDIDGDTPTFTRNFTYGTFNTSSGNLSWQAGYGNYSWQICADDGYGSTSCAGFTVQVNDTHAPSQVINLNNTTSPTKDSVELTWDAATDGVNGSGVASYTIERLNESINKLSIDRPVINATGIAAGYEPDASWYSFKTNSPVNCDSCHVGFGRYNKTGNFWMKYNATKLYLMVHAPDNDSNSSDDSVRFAFDLYLNGGTAPQTDDQMYEIFENGTLVRYSGNGTSWVTNSTGATGAVSGAGSLSPRYELEIPLSELNNPSNNTITKFLFENVCRNGTDFIERHTYYPISITADEDNPSTWGLTTFREIANYVTVSSTANTNIQLSGLTSSTRYNLTAKAIDNVGNVGQRSSPLIVNTTVETGFNVSGYVFNSNGQPIPKANVTVETRDYTVGISDTGLYEFHDLINGSYTITATSGNYSNTSNITVNGSDIVNVNFTISSIPGTPTGLTTTCGNFYCNSTWTAGNYTTAFNVNVNGTWYNGSSSNYINVSIAPHGFSNITVIGVNGYTNETSGSATQSTQIANNPITISNISSSYVILSGQSLTILPAYSDADGDTPTFDRNFTKGTFNSTSGETHWNPTLAENGTYNWKINVTDGWGSTDTKSFTVSVIDLHISNLNVAKITAKTIAWTWTNPVSGYYSCTEIYFDGVYQSCSSTASSYKTALVPNTAHTISLRAKDTSGFFYNFSNDTQTTLTSTSSPTISSSYPSAWFSPNNGQNFAILTNYNSSVVPIQSITIVIRTKDENDYVRTITTPYSYDYTVVNTSKTVNWNGKADNYQIVPDAYYVSQVTVEDFDNNTAVFSNVTYIGVDNTFPSSIMDSSQSRLFQALYYKSNYSSTDILRVNIGYYYGDYNTSSYITTNPITQSTTLSNLVIRKEGFISTSAGVHTFSITKDSDGKAWMWVDGILVYNSNAGLLSTDMALSGGSHNVSIEYAKGTANTPITLLPTIDGSTMSFVSPISGDFLSLFAHDFNGSGVGTIKYSIDDGATYQTYSSPANISGAGVITVCSNDSVSNLETCKRYTPTFSTISPSQPSINGNNAPNPPPSNASSPTFPQYQYLLPNITAAIALLQNPSPQNGSFDTTATESNSTGWYGGWPCCNYGSYTYDYLDRPIYYAHNEDVGNGSWGLFWPVNYDLSVVQYNTSYDARVRTSNANNVSYDLFSVTAHPFISEKKTVQTRSLKWQPFGIFRADVSRDLLAYPFYQWLSYAQAIYAPNSTVIPVQSSYNLNDTIQFTVNVLPWDDTDSSTQEIQDVQLILYSPSNPYTGESAKLIKVFDVGTVTRTGGTWTFNYGTNLYTDLVGTYNVILWMPSIGGNIYENSTTVGYGSIDPALYNTIKLSQYNFVISCPVGWCYLTMNYTSKTLLELDNLFSTDTIQGKYNATSQKYENHRTGYAFNQNVTVAHKEGYYYYFTSPSNVMVSPVTNPAITLKPGWNLVGNYGTSARTLSALKSSVGASATQAKYYDKALKTWVSSDSQSVPAMEAFLVYVTDQVEWGG